MRLSDWMTPNPVTVTPETAVPEAAKLMKAGGFRRLPVLRGEELVGIVTDRDLKQAMPSDATTLTAWEIPILLAKLKVREVMSSPVSTLGVDATLEEAARLLLERRFGGLPVLARDGRLAGIVTVTDILKAFLEASRKPALAGG